MEERDGINLAVDNGSLDPFQPLQRGWEGGNSNKFPAHQFRDREPFPGGASG